MTPLLPLKRPYLTRKSDLMQVLSEMKLLFLNSPKNDFHANHNVSFMLVQVKSISQCAAIIALWLLPATVRASETCYGHTPGINPPSRRLDFVEETALKALCPLALRANGPFGNPGINAAISSIAFGKNWPDNDAATAYKVCNFRGYGGLLNEGGYLDGIR